VRGDWCKQNPAAAADALESVWSSETSVAVALARFDRRVPRTVLEGAGTRLSIASFLLLGVDPRDFPFFRPVAVQHQYELVGFDRSAHDADLGNRYEEWLAFLDRLIGALAKRDVAVRDRLDAQGIAWWLAEADPPGALGSERARRACGCPRRIARAGSIGPGPPEWRLAACARGVTAAAQRKQDRGAGLAWDDEVVPRDRRRRCRVRDDRGTPNRPRRHRVLPGLLDRLEKRPRPSGVPVEAERLEAIGSALDHARVLAHKTERAKREGLEIGVRLQ
jgi:hypothetical protein